jgi:hypothetical protein
MAKPLKPFGGTITSVKITPTTPPIQITPVEFIPMLVPDMELEKEMQQYENQFCLGKPLQFIDLFDRYGLGCSEPELRNKLYEFLRSLPDDKAQDPNKVPDFVEMVRLKHGNLTFTEPGKMYKCVEEAPAYDAQSLAVVESRLAEYKYPYAPKGILEGTHCMALNEDYWFFKVFPKKFRDRDVTMINHDRSRYGLKPMPEIYVVRRINFLCFHPEIAKRHEDPPKHLNPNAFREERPHIRTVLAQPDYVGMLDKWFRLMTKPPKNFVKDPNLR